MVGRQREGVDQPPPCHHLETCGGLGWMEEGRQLISSAPTAPTGYGAKVGACIVNADNRIVGVGYNGMPDGCSDEVMPWEKESDDTLKTKRLYVCHAVMNAIVNKLQVDIRGCIIYVSLYPCNECAKLIIQSGIKEVIYYSNKYREKDFSRAARHLFEVAGVKVRGKNEKRIDYLSWDEYFMAVAFLSAQRSKDPRTQVGACIVNDENKIVGIGYNGMPIGCSDDIMPWGRDSDNLLERKYYYVCHAEMNAILNKNAVEVKHCRIYVALFPCNECAKLIIQSGIKEVIYCSDKYAGKEAFKASRFLLSQAGVLMRQFESQQKQVTIDFTSLEKGEEEAKNGEKKTNYQHSASGAAQNPDSPSEFPPCEGSAPEVTEQV